MAVPVMMYGNENWSLNRSHKRKTEAAEMARHTFWDKKKKEAAT